MPDPVFSTDGVDPSLLPLEELADCAATALTADGKRILSYDSGAGYAPLRELIGEWLGVDPARVVLTNGSLHGLALVATAVSRSRPVVAEYPVADRSERVFHAAGAVLASVDVRDDGLAADQLRQLLTEYLRPALVYTIPAFHNPTGALMSLARRRVVVELIAARNGVLREDILLLEDDSYGLTRFEGERLPSLLEVSGGATGYLSSFSTTVAPGLRVGWLVLPDALAGQIAAAANATYISPVQLGQATVYEFIRRGSFEAHLGRLREALRLRRDTLVEALGEHFPDGEWTVPGGGFFLWLRLPVGTDSRVLLERAAVRFGEPGTAFSSTANNIRLSFAAVSPDELASGIERLAAAGDGHFSTMK
jgi:DNA-binding transcriptional MocR family regulator